MTKFFLLLASSLFIGILFWYAWPSIEAWRAEMKIQQVSKRTAEVSILEQLNLLSHKITVLDARQVDQQVLRKELEELRANLHLIQQSLEKRRLEDNHTNGMTGNVQPRQRSGWLWVGDEATIAIVEGSTYWISLHDSHAIHGGRQVREAFRKIYLREQA